MHLSIPSSSGQPLPPGSYIGPQFFGFLWQKNQSKPLRANIFGKIGMVPASDETGPIKASALHSLFITFETYIMDPSQKYKYGGTLVIAPSGLDAKITLNNQDIKNFTYSDDTISWPASQDSATNASISFHINATETKANPVPGLQFSGRYWFASEKPPIRPNVFGQVGESEDPSSASRDAQVMAMWKSAGVNLGLGVAATNLGRPSSTITELSLHRLIPLTQQSNKP